MIGSTPWDKGALIKETIETIQINLGDRCNQSCAHCHIGASPAGSNNMDEDTALRILDRVLRLDIPNIEFTGGTPEMNPNLPLFIDRLASSDRSLTVRTSLTVLDIPEYAPYIDIYRNHRVRIVASLPGASEDETDRQRGAGAFRISISMLRRLNKMGYGLNGLILDLVYNATDDRLPPDQTRLEQDFKRILNERHGVFFNRLAVIVNAPINRFRRFLLNAGRLDAYMQELRKRFNPDTLQHVMCRRLISVDYSGKIYDCDFNLALGIPIKGHEAESFWEIDFSDFHPEITCSEHCFACTVGKGSSCRGALLGEGPPCCSARSGESC